MNELKIYCEGRDFSRLEEGFSGEFDSDCALSCEIVTVDGEEIRRLNREIRGVDAVTDVLSFPALDLKPAEKICKAKFPYDTDEQGDLFIGSIAICEKRAAEQAEEYGHGFERELYYLAAHGVCHLLGYDHMEESEKSVMRDKEERVLSKINITRDGE